LGIATSAESEAVKLAAIKHMLALAGFNEKHTVDVSVGQPQPWEQLVTGLAPMTRAESRAARGVPDDPPQIALETATESAQRVRVPRDDVVDAEVVPDPPADRPSWAEDEPATPDQGNGPSDPGNGYMTMEQAKAEIARRNRAANERGVRIRDIR
jgi:hypothetical protein